MDGGDDVSRELCSRASRGDERAIDELIELHLPGLRAFVRGRIGGVVEARESAGDLVQSACREVLEHAGRFRYDGEEGFKRWLYATALRKIQDRHRYWTAQKRDAARDVPIAQAEGESGSQWLLELCRSSFSPSRAVVVQEEWERVQAAFERLPERYGEIIRLAYAEQMPHAEIAQRLEITEPNARMLLSRALARLARFLREGG